MINKYGQFIKTLRIKKGFSQSFMAEKLNISRPSYIGIEHGIREITLEEAEKLKDLFGISIEEFTNATPPKYEKYKQMILACLRCSSAQDGKIPKTKLAKLLYLADFAWYYKNLQSMSGMQYLRRAYGPVPDPYFRALTELEENGKISIDHKGDSFLVSSSGSSSKQKFDLLNDKELNLIKKISAKWKNKNTRDIVDFTHEQLPYKICSPDEIIPYELIIQQDPDYVY
ncbi:MAG: type II toxin-antitoxin system antitoxin SocA domain-containing protein [Candidatus Paceibacterota bacterium]|jgi:transcriptional regulator with XRE-family HTH domain